MKLVAVIVAILIVTGAAIAAVILSLPSTRPGLDNTLTIGHLFAIDNLNPFIGFSNEAYLFYSLVYDYLFSLDPDGETYVPNIALSSATPDGGATWVYQIRQGVKWHDGTDLTVEDVNFTINYNIQNFWLLWAYEPYLNQVKQCRAGEVLNCGARVTGPWEVTVYFERPFSPGARAMVFPIIQKEQWKSVDPYSAQYSYPNRNPIGTGPYKADPRIYEQWLNGEPLVLQANPDYHFGAPEVDQVVFRLFDDETSMVAALLRGEIDVAMLSAAGADAVRIRTAGDPSFEIQEGPTVIQYWIDIGITQLNHLGVNRRLNPARFDLAVRQAMAHATDKEYILQQFYLGKGVAGSTLVSPVSPFWHYEPTTDAFEFSLDQANATLDAAGYDARDADGIRKASRDIVLDLYCSPENLARQCQQQVTVPKDQRLSFTMVTRAEAPEERDLADYLKAVWRAIGIELLITTEFEIAMNTDVYGGEFDAYIWWWSADADPNYILSIQSNFTLNGWSDNYFDNETYNRLYLEQLSALDLAERQRIVHEAQRVHYLAAPFIILVYPFFHYAWWTDEFEGWGDMNAEPGRQLGAFWGKHPLFLDLTPTGAGAGGAGPQGGLAAVLVAAGVLAVAAASVVLVLLSRRRRKAQDALPELPRIQPPPRP